MVDLTLIERLLLQDETSLEATVIHNLRIAEEAKTDGDLPDMRKWLGFVLDQKEALRQIDAWTIEDVLDVRLEELRKRAPHPPMTRNPGTVPVDVRRRVDDMQNFLEGLNNDATRPEFEAFAQATGLYRMSIREAAPLIAPLKRVQNGKAGRPPVRVPWENVQDQMRRILLVTAGGGSVEEAARQVAGEENKSGERDRARRYAKLFRQKMRLRE